MRKTKETPAGGRKPAGATKPKETNKEHSEYSAGVSWTLHLTNTRESEVKTKKTRADLKDQEKAIFRILQGSGKCGEALRRERQEALQRMLRQ